MKDGTSAASATHSFTWLPQNTSHGIPLSHTDDTDSESSFIKEKTSFLGSKKFDDAEEMSSANQCAQERNTFSILRLPCSIIYLHHKLSRKFPAAICANVIDLV